MINENELFSAFQQLERKIKALRSTSEGNRKRVEELQKANKDLRQKNRTLEVQLKELEKKQSDSEKMAAKSKDFVKIVSNNLSGTDANAELKQQLDEYIRELERCIAHLSSLS